MGASFSCSVATIRDDDMTYARAMVDRLRCDEYGRCRDCMASDGNFHHPGCDQEECPKCRGQLISCGCFDHLFAASEPGEVDS
jgi:hypothetical protein